MVKEQVFYERTHYLGSNTLPGFKDKIKPYFKTDISDNALNGLIRDIYLDEIHDKKGKGIKGSTYEKTRIRFCGKNFSKVFIEYISKYKGQTKYCSEEISREESILILTGKTKWMLNSSSHIIREIGVKSITELFCPNKICEFYRETYRHKGKQDITLNFDSNIKEIEYTDFDGVFTQIHESFITDENTVIMNVKFKKPISEQLQKVLNIAL